MHLWGSPAPLAPAAIKAASSPSAKVGLDSSKKPKKAPTTCGLCEATGHSRNNKICPMYNDPDEVERRRACTQKRLDKQVAALCVCAKEEMLAWMGR